MEAESEGVVGRCIEGEERNVEGSAWMEEEKKIDKRGNWKDG